MISVTKENLARKKIPNESPITFKVESRFTLYVYQLPLKACFVLGIYLGTRLF